MADPTEPNAREARTNTTRVAAAGFAFLVASGFATPALAQSAPDEDWLPAPHVRPDRSIRSLVDEAVRRSPVIRDLIDQLEKLDVTVYIRQRMFAELALEGHVALLATVHGHRYLVIELACGRPGVSQMATLGHELFHAVEIANEPSIVNARTLAAFYARVGRETGNTVGRQTFETDAAVDAGKRARRDLLTKQTRSGDGS